MTPGHLLLVDDDARLTRMIRRLAEQVGFTVTEVNDPLHFEAAYRSVPASLIILDLNMPGKDGIELLDFLAKESCKARVMFISGVDKRVLGTTEQLAKCRGLDFAGVLEKPIDMTRLRRAFDDHARLHGAATVEDLDEALDSGQIAVAYQAKIEVRTGKVVGAEALARWNHPVLGPVNPEWFVSMAERTGRIETLTRTVVEQALRAARDWSSLVPDMEVAVNLSPQLLSDASLPDSLADAMSSIGFPAERLKLEVTERGLMDDTNQSMAILSRLRLKGVGLSIDDFGTGSSSLVQLYRMPFGEIKIDKSFVMEMLTHREAKVIVGSIIQLGKSMELNAVAEGVEDQATLDTLNDMGCDQVQGYHFGRPLPEPDFSDWLRSFTQQAG